MKRQGAKKVVSDSLRLVDFVIELAEMTCGLVHASYSLPEWQAVKLTFFVP